MRYHASPRIAVIIAGLVLVTSFAGGCVSTGRVVRMTTPVHCSLSAQQRAVLLNAPVVPIVFIETIGKPAEQPAGSATVIDRSRILVSDHQVDQDEGIAVINGHITSYTVVKRLDGSTAASGWVLIELLTPILRSFSPVSVDFEATPAIGDAIFTVYCLSYSQSEVAKQNASSDGTKRAGETTVAEGRIVLPLFEDRDERLDEFLLADVECPFGASGAPVFWWPDRSKTPCLIGINAGVKRYRDTATGELLGSIQLIRQPRELMNWTDGGK